MNPEIKQRWIDALRSGVYPQGNGYLARSLDGKIEYCCLGVLCELAVDAGVIPPAKKEHSVLWYEGLARLLPKKVKDWAGLKSDNPQTRPYGTTLSRMNDGDVPFVEIAREIEEHL